MNRNNFVWVLAGARFYCIANGVKIVLYFTTMHQGKLAMKFFDYIWKYFLEGAIISIYLPLKNISFH
ncbi:MAG TPA: hypothetical protein DDZ83_13075 [Nitrospinae bacterium]|nr:hypothetical protein [Nitrospinota bacterium]